jgi:predicted dehydrogenase
MPLIVVAPTRRAVETIAETVALTMDEQLLAVRARRVVERHRAIGQPVMVRGSFSFPLDNPGDVRLDPALGGGSLWDVGCYPLSYARTVLGEAPVEVSAWQHSSDSGVDLTLWGALRFPSGAVAQIDSSFEAPFRTNLEIVGADGVIVVPVPFKPGSTETILLGPHVDALEPVAMPDGSLYQGEVEDLADAVLTGASPRVTLADSRTNTAAIVALLESAANGGKPVAL